MEENPMLNRVYVTGVFFFIMMYTGSNILPISRFLQLSHLRQNTYTAQQVTNILDGSKYEYDLANATRTKIIRAKHNNTT